MAPLKGAGNLDQSVNYKYYAPNGAQKPRRLRFDRHREPLIVNRDVCFDLVVDNLLFELTTFSSDFYGEGHVPAGHFFVVAQYGFKFNFGAPHNALRLDLDWHEIISVHVEVARLTVRHSHFQFVGISPFD